MVLGGHSIEVGIGGSSSCWHFGLSLKVAALLSPGSMAVVPTAQPCVPMGFLGGSMILPLYLGCLYLMKAFPILQMASENLLLKCSFCASAKLCFLATGAVTALCNASFIPQVWKGLGRVNHKTAFTTTLSGISASMPQASL